MEGFGCQAEKASFRHGLSGIKDKVKKDLFDAAFIQEREIEVFSVVVFFDLDVLLKSGEFWIREMTSSSICRISLFSFSEPYHP